MTADKTALQVGQVVIFGRVELVERLDSFTVTNIRMPAADTYSSPEIVQVRSEKPFARKGDEVEAICRVGGFLGNAFDRKDKATGEITRVRPVNNVLRLVE